MGRWGLSKKRWRRGLLAIGAVAVVAGGVATLPTLPEAQPALGVLPTEDDDLDLLEKLGLMEGHLLIGRQLVEANMIRDALPHFGHPVSELYNYLKPELERRNVPDFKAQLDALEEHVTAAGGGPRMIALYDEVVAGIRKGVLTVSAEQRRSPQFMLGVIALLIEDAMMDFEESIERGNVASRVEYHDAMGFIQQAEAMVQDLRAVAPPEWQDRLRAAEDEVASAGQAFPTLEPPARPLRSYEHLRFNAARVLALTR
jgi:hypothetical protein